MTSIEPFRPSRVVGGEPKIVPFLCRDFEGSALRASQAVCRISKLRVINTDRGSEFLPLRHAVWTDANSLRSSLKSSRKARADLIQNAANFRRSSFL
jgi:hypothetical protein